MPSDEYEIGIRSEQSDKMMLRNWSGKVLLNPKTIGFLRARNAAREHIYIRPESPHRYTLLDDITQASIARMESQGFSPSLVIQTSSGNFQAWLDHGQILENDLSTFVAQQLAIKFDADSSSADFRHFGRLPGFTNVKEKYFTGLFYPFVKIVESTNHVYRQATDFIRQRRADFKSLQTELLSLKSSHEGGSQTQFAMSKVIEDFYENPKYAGDYHRADLAFSVYAVNHGVSENDLFDILANRDLTKKGNVKRQRQYIERTIKKALRY